MEACPDAFNVILEVGTPDMGLCLCAGADGGRAARGPLVMACIADIKLLAEGGREEGTAD